MKPSLLISFIAVVVLLVGTYIYFFASPAPTTPAQQNAQQVQNSPTLPTHPNISLDSVPSLVSTSPLTITGKARLWYFEGSFPVSLRDANGALIAQAPAQAQGEWMTTEFVPFSVTLTWLTPPTTATGTLVFQKDNPSGDPSRDELYAVPVRFY